MKEANSLDVIIANFDSGQRKGRIFSSVLTLVITVGIFSAILIGISLTSNNYSLIQQTYASEIQAKTDEIKTAKELNQNLTLSLENIKKENLLFIEKLEKKDNQIALLSEEKVKILKENKILKAEKRTLLNEIYKLKKVSFGSSVSSVNLGETSSNQGR